MTAAAEVLTKETKMATKDLGVRRAEDRALVLIDYQPARVVTDANRQRLRAHSVRR